MRRRFSAVLIIMIILAAAVGHGAAKPVVELLPEAEVSGADIFFADIAEFEDEETKDSLGNVYLGAAALPGSNRRLTLGQIEVRLRQAGIHPRDLEITGAKEVWVTTAAVHPKENPSTQDSLYSGKETSISLGYGKTHIYQVVVPVRDIARHELIALEDLRVEEREGRTVPSNLASVDDLVGNRATRLLPAGSELTIYAAEVPPAVERGDTVTLMVTAGSITVTTIGKVQQAGAVGDLIPVENTNTRKIVYGEVISSDLVKIEIGGLK